MPIIDDVNYMGDLIGFSLLAALVAFLASSAVIPLVRRLALAIRALDYPGGRREEKSHGIPRLGGVAIVAGLFAAQGVVAALRWGEWRYGNTTVELIAIPLAVFLVFACGLLEDTIGLSASTRVIMQTVAALMALNVGWSFHSIYLPVVGTVQLGMLTGLISLIWIVGVTNAVNLLDGLDGLAGGVAAIIASSMLVFSVWYLDFMTAVTMGAIVGACLGFLRRNWAPAQIYLGDAGSLTLGFVLAIVSIRSSVKGPAAVAILVPILALGLPVFDTLLVMLFRFSRNARGSRRSLGRRTARMFRPDRNHIHHLMLWLGPGRRRIVVALYAVAVAFCAMALIVAVSRRIALGFFLVGLEILVVFMIRHLGFRAETLRISLKKRKEAREALLEAAAPAAAEQYGELGSTPTAG